MNASLGQPTNPISSPELPPLQVYILSTHTPLLLCSLGIKSIILYDKGKRVEVNM
jgi:hypothetical protein